MAAGPTLGASVATVPVVPQTSAANSTAATPLNKPVRIMSRPVYVKDIKVNRFGAVTARR